MYQQTLLADKKCMKTIDHQVETFDAERGVDMFDTGFGGRPVQRLAGNSFETRCQPAPVAQTTWPAAQCNSVSFNSTFETVICRGLATAMTTLYANSPVRGSCEST